LLFFYIHDNGSGILWKHVVKIGLSLEELHIPDLGFMYCNVVSRFRQFGGTCCFHLQGWRYRVKGDHRYKMSVQSAKTVHHQNPKYYVCTIPTITTWELT